MIRNSRKFVINEFAINVEKMYRLCTFLAGELEKLRNKRKFAISVFVISEFYCRPFSGRLHSFIISEVFVHVLPDYQVFTLII